MDKLDLVAFTDLFGKVCRKCFGHPLEDPLTETESKLLYNKIFDSTGLTIGWKSLKNYSFFIINDGQGGGNPGGKRENPSVATLDTLSRYMLDAPYTTETERKKKEEHHPYWFRYKEQVLRGRVLPGGGEAAEMGGAVVPGGVTSGGKNADMGKPVVPGTVTGGDRGGTVVPGTGVNGDRRAGAPVKGTVDRRMLRAGTVFVTVAILLTVLSLIFRHKRGRSFTDNFRTVQEDSMMARGWIIKDRDTAYWSRRGEQPGYLSLFTLKGDNWPDPAQAPRIRNLLLYPIPCDCFTLEIHLKDFIPGQNWQQAGILLSEDTNFTGKSIRISIAYNDYTGGFPVSRQILVQAITSAGGGAGGGSGKPEEIAHIPLYNADSLEKNPVLSKNLENSALRIEKRGTTFRLLYANGSFENTSFKEIVSHEYVMTPRYAGVFALKGFVEQSDNIPVLFNYFSLRCEACGK